MEELFGQIVKAIVAVGGAGALTIALLLVIIWMLWSELRKSEKARREEADACDKSREALHEKRLEESKSVLVALTSNTASAAALATSVEARSQILNEVTKALQAMADRQESSRIYFIDAVKRLEDSQRDTVRLLQRLIDQNDRRRG